ncbi:MAG: cyclic nucleotide-binding and patatin-like phospholipase domain-containing protein [Hyphomicrobiales bacterium]|nr:cyclic nucleotide-binding and patatin-like phospholipase domain-containing protein [Hyphomicrobiales bacterium]
MKPNMSADWLQAVEAFAGLGQAELRRLLTRCYTRAVAPGEAVAEAGASADALHILISGRLSASDGAGETLELAPGAAVGYPAFFAREAYRETVAAARESLMLTLEWDEFAQLADRAPEYWQAVAVAMAKRGPAEPVRSRFPKPHTLAILGAGASPPPPDIVSEIAAALDPLADCQVLRSSSFGQNLPGGITLDDPEVAHWLQEQQLSFDLIIRVADAELTGWTRQAVAEADEILLVAHANAGFGLGEPEAFAFKTRGPSACRLITVEDGARDARAWLADRPVRLHHRVRLRPSSGFDRLARFVLGRARGYIACGGGGYAGAHLGLIQALEEAGATIDCVAGVGAGAIAAAFAAAGAPVADAAALLPPPRSRTEYERLVAAAFGRSHIDNLALPFRALSADLSHGALVVHKAGPLIESLLANWPPPGLAAPFIDGAGRHLADGGLIDPAPDWLLGDVHGGVNVLGRIEPPLAAPARDPASPVDWALKRLTGARGDALEPFDAVNVMLRGMNMRRVEKAQAALTLSPPMLPGAEGQDAARELAYDWARRELDVLRQDERWAAFFGG